MTYGEAAIFKNYFSWTIRRNIPIFFLWFIVYLIPQVIPYLLSSKEIPNYEFIGYMQKTSLVLSVVDIFFVIVIVRRCFGYMHEKVATDLVHALPAKRRTQLLGPLSAILLGTAVIIFGVGMLSVLAAMLRDTSFSITAPETMPWLLLHYAGTISTIALLLTFFVLLGNSFDATAHFLGVQILWFILVVSTVAMMTDLLPTALTGKHVGNLLSENGAVHFLSFFMSPSLAVITASVVDYLSNGKQHFPWFFIAYWYVYAVVVFALSLFFYQKRESEDAENISTDKLSYRILRALCIFLSVYVISAFFKGIFGSATAFFTGAFIGALLSYLVIELIFGRGVRTLKKSIHVLIIVPAVFFAIYFTLAFDIFKFSFNKVTALPENVELSLNVWRNGVKSRLTEKSDNLQAREIVFKAAQAQNNFLSQKKIFGNNSDLLKEILNKYQISGKFKIDTQKISLNNNTVSINFDDNIWILCSLMSEDGNWAKAFPKMLKRCAEDNYVDSYD